MRGNTALTVSQLNAYVQRTLQMDPLLRDVQVAGELSNVRFYPNGMLFFTLKDEAAALSCVMFSEAAESLSLEPYEGLRCVLRGSVGLYERGGQYRMTVRNLRPDGEGALYERLRLLRDRLSKEGLFDRERKKPLPRFVDTLGVVSSPAGAAFHDILNVSLRRDARLSILLAPSRVQGIGAAEELCRAIRALDQTERVSVIIVARGGGSIEDLWAFNEEKVVRAVAACRKPVISAVGHETDITLCDLAADLRAPTPSAAAELAVSLRQETLDALTEVAERMTDVIRLRLHQAGTNLQLAQARLETQHPKNRLADERHRLDLVEAAIYAAMNSRLQAADRALTFYEQKLALMNPYEVLKRGYAIVERGGILVTEAARLTVGDDVRLRFADGAVQAEIRGSEGS